MSMLCFPEDAVQGCLCGFYYHFPANFQSSVIQHYSFSVASCLGQKQWNPATVAGVWSPVKVAEAVPCKIAVSGYSCAWARTPACGVCCRWSAWVTAGTMRLLTGILVILHALHSFVPAHSKNVHVCALFRFSSSSAVFCPDKWRCFTL